MFNYYKYKNKLLFTKLKYSNLEEISESEASVIEGKIFYLYKLPTSTSRKSFCISHPSLFFIEEEGLSLLDLQNSDSYSIPKWILNKIEHRSIQGLNTQYSNWVELLELSYPSQWKINIVGTGDVGGILTTGLRLIGGTEIMELGLYGKDPNSTKRWEYEINQILSPFSNQHFPRVKIIDENQLFDCDLFIFSASAGVPPLGQEKKDVRMAQFEGNAKIISSYAKLARRSNFKGIFAVVSDPVDLLCKAALLASNRNNDGEMDYLGLAPEQIRGYGLGVMHARAVYYSQKKDETQHYVKAGRAFGPHGDGLIIADSIENYDPALSLYLTENTKNANLDVRNTGFKPYIAPALSSGALSIIATIKGEWHYSSTFMGGVYMGAKNRLNSTGTEIEQLILPKILKDRLLHTYRELSKIL